MLPPIEPMTYQRAQNRQYYLRVLNDLIDIGAELSDGLIRQVRAQTDPFRPLSGYVTSRSADPTVAYQRLANSICRTIALAAKLNEPVTLHSRVAGRRVSRKPNLIITIRPALPDESGKDTDQPE